MSCNGGSDGTALYTVTGGTEPYNIENQFDLTAGDYTTIVSDANGCEALVSFNISEPDTLEASVSISNALCNGELGSAELIITGGTLPYDIDDLSS